MTRMSSLVAAAFLLALPGAAVSQCLSPEFIDRAIAGIELSTVAGTSVESSVEVGTVPGVAVARLSRPDYEITIIKGHDDIGALGVVFGSVVADVSVVDPAAEGVERTSFVLNYGPDVVDLSCVDDSILSDGLLIEEIEQLMARAGRE